MDDRDGDHPWVMAPGHNTRMNKNIRESYLAEQLRQITHYVMVEFHRITYYLTEQFRQIAHYLAEHLIQMNNILYQLLGHGRGTVPTSKVCKRKFKIPAGIPVNSFIRFRPEPESSIKIPVPV